MRRDGGFNQNHQYHNSSIKPKAQSGNSSRTPPNQSSRKIGEVPLKLDPRQQLRSRDSMSPNTILTTTDLSTSIMSDSEEEDNGSYALFRDCLSTTLVKSERKTAKAERKPRRRAKATNTATDTATPVPARDSQDPGQVAEELSDFVDYLATEIFENLPAELQDLEYRSWRESEALQNQYSMPLTTSSLSHLNLPASVPETLRTYTLISPDPTMDSALPATLEDFLLPILTSYISTLTTPPPASTASRTDECEICDRSWIPLSYHHLIPRFVHDKAVKRGWHRKEDLQNVAWLCGACHRFVHHFKTHEELARHYYTVELLLEEEEVQRWAAWVGKLRWKGARTRTGRK